ncbi:MAG: hypothetical protein ACR2HV_07830 [Acidimicrobiales bacterium]
MATSNAVMTATFAGTNAGPVPNAHVNSRAAHRVRAEQVQPPGPGPRPDPGQHDVQGHRSVASRDQKGRHPEDDPHRTQRVHDSRGIPEGVGEGVHGAQEVEIEIALRLRPDAQDSRADRPGDEVDDVDRLAFDRLGGHADPGHGRRT